MKNIDFENKELMNEFRIFLYNKFLGFFSYVNSDDFNKDGIQYFDDLINKMKDYDILDEDLSSMYLEQCKGENNFKKKIFCLYKFVPKLFCIYERLYDTFFEVTYSGENYDIKIEKMDMKNLMDDSQYLFFFQLLNSYDNISGLLKDSHQTILRNEDYMIFIYRVQEYLNDIKKIGINDLECNRSNGMYAVSHEVMPYLLNVYRDIGNNLEYICHCWEFRDETLINYDMYKELYDFHLSFYESLEKKRLRKRFTKCLSNYNNKISNYD